MVNVAALYERPDEATVHEDWMSGFAALLRQEGCAKRVTAVRTSAFSTTKARGAFARPTRAQPGRGSLRSRVATTHPTSSGSIRT